MQRTCRIAWAGKDSLAPAVANAVAKLGGPRVRRLPFTRSGLVAT